MNCTKCNYLLWDLRECRCPECAEPFDVTRFAFRPESVHFSCPHCDQRYLGTDETGLPSPRRFDCVSCREAVVVATMPVHPLSDEAYGEPQNQGTPWDYRDRVGFIPALLDGVARLATQPHEYFQRATRSRGSLLFSIICAYLSAAVSIGLVVFLIKGHVIGTTLNAAFLVEPRFWLLLAIGVPVLQIAWNYLFGFFIFAVLKLLGLQSGDYDRSVHAVAYGSAVLPALFLLPPVGLPWYINVVSSGGGTLQRNHSGTRNSCGRRAAFAGRQSGALFPLRDDSRVGADSEPTTEVVGKRGPIAVRGSEIAS